MCVSGSYHQKIEIDRERQTHTHTQRERERERERERGRERAERSRLLRTFRRVYSFFSLDPPCVELQPQFPDINCFGGGNGDNLKLIILTAAGCKIMRLLGMRATNKNCGMYMLNNAPIPTPPQKKLKKNKQTNKTYRACE